MNIYFLFRIAIQIYPPSYVSLESVLSAYNLIPGSAFTTTSVSPKKTDRLQASVGRFFYRQIKPSYFGGGRTIKFRGQEIEPAKPEKVILDYLYFKPYLKAGR